MTASADCTSTTLREYPIPLRMRISRLVLPSPMSGRMPTVVPPCSFAPLHAASITPPIPPQTSVPWFVATRRPTSCAAAYSSGVQSAAPITAICILVHQTGCIKNCAILFTIITLCSEINILKHAWARTPVICEGQREGSRSEL